MMEPAKRRQTFLQWICEFARPTRRKAAKLSDGVAKDCLPENRRHGAITAYQTN
jgi:hypothetical protein